MRVCVGVIRVSGCSGCRAQNFAGLDGLRTIALILVTLQHSLTLTGHEVWTACYGISIGQLGVALFLSVSGFLSSRSHRPPLDWLTQRLVRIFPAFWITMVLSFFLTAISGYKSFDAYQVVSQFLGLGYFTHSWNLVNSPTWFVSLLLMCYAGTFLARLLRHPKLLTVLASILLLSTSLLMPHSRLLVIHALTYTIASSVASMNAARRVHVLASISGILLSVEMFSDVSLEYPGLAIAILAVALPVRRVPDIIRLVAEYSYEYYLVHGIALVGMVRLFPSRPVLAIGCGILVGAAAAICLNGLVRGIASFVRRRITAGARQRRQALAPFSSIDAASDQVASQPAPFFEFAMDNSTIQSDTTYTRS